MAFFRLLLILFSTLSIAISIPTQDHKAASDQNVFRIFNAIHSSMRQWGSSLNHNGMSYFPATVPAGVDFYHGTGSSEPVNGMEWLAFEPEHALVFARVGRRGGGGPPGDKPPAPPPDGEPPHGRSYEKITNGALSQIVMNSDRRVGKEEPINPPPESWTPGFLHTYTSRKALQLLYIDGMSAGKTPNGTLDSQDLVLLYDRDPESDGHDQMFHEYFRAQALCNYSTNAWNGRVDGFIRMEAGFEIIMCDFETSVEVKSIARAGGGGHGDGDEKDLEGIREWGDIDYLRAISDRYHGIGGGRVRLNYESMVTAYTLEDDLFETGERGPRLKHLSNTTRDALRSQIDRAVMSDPSPWANEGINWQAVADMIVTRYSPRLQYLIHPVVTSDESRFNFEVNELLRAFIDSSNRSLPLEVSHCTNHFLPPAYSPSLAASTVSTVSRHICKTLFRALEEDSISEQVSMIKDLIETLQWTTWKECGKCGYDEVCSIPIWPFGSEADWEKPACSNATRLRMQRGYWGSLHLPWRGPPGNGSDEVARMT